MLSCATLVVGLTIGSCATATAFFQIDANPGGVNLFMDAAKNASGSFGTVVNNDDVAVAALGNSDFANGFSTVKPVKIGSLTELLFTPVDPNAFSSFSFRGQDILAGQTIDVTVQDNQGHAAETFHFLQGDANQDFAREGILSAIAGETIKWVRISNSGGFEEAKQFEFDLAGSVPEPAIWAMMLVGFGAIGSTLRGARRRAIAG